MAIVHVIIALIIVSTIINAYTKPLVLALFGRNKEKKEEELPIGDLRKFKVSERTHCINKYGRRSRLTYFSDALNQYWFKIEKINSRGKVIGKPVFERATVYLSEKSEEYI